MLQKISSWKRFQFFETKRLLIFSTALFLQYYPLYNSTDKKVININGVTAFLSDLSPGTRYHVRVQSNSPNFTYVQQVGTTEFWTCKKIVFIFYEKCLLNFYARLAHVCLHNYLVYVLSTVVSWLDICVRIVSMIFRCPYVIPEPIAN